MGRRASHHLMIHQQVGHWQSGLVLCGSAHWKAPLHTPRQAQVGSAEQAAGTVTQWWDGPPRTSSVTHTSPALAHESHEPTSEHCEAGRQPPA